MWQTGKLQPHHSGLIPVDAKAAMNSDIIVMDGEKRQEEKQRAVWILNLNRNYSSLHEFKSMLPPFDIINQPIQYQCRNMTRSWDIFSHKECSPMEHVRPNIYSFSLSNCTAILATIAGLALLQWSLHLDVVHLEPNALLLEIVSSMHWINNTASFIHWTCKNHNNSSHVQHKTDTNFITQSRLSDGNWHWYVCYQCLIIAAWRLRLEATRQSRLCPWYGRCALLHRHY